MFFLSFIWSSLPKGVLLFWGHYWTKSRTQMPEDRTHSPMEPLASESFPVGLIEYKIHTPFIFYHCCIGFCSDGKCCSLGCSLPQHQESSLRSSRQGKVRLLLFVTQSLPMPDPSTEVYPWSQPWEAFLTPRFNLSSSFFLTFAKSFFKEGTSTGNPGNVSILLAVRNSYLTVLQTQPRIRNWP